MIAVKYFKKRPIFYRKLVLSLSRNKIVLNIGCAAWPYTKSLYEKGILTQLLLRKVAKKAYGIDISEEGISFLKRKGIENLYVWDIYKLDKLEIEDKIDLIIFAEVLEHLDNPGMALRSIRKFMLRNNPEARLLVTAPNIYNLDETLFEIFKGYEFVHEDHKMYFSYYTLRNLLEQVGFQIIDWYYLLLYGYFYLPRFNIIKGKRRLLRVAILRLFPWTAHSIGFLVALRK